MLGLWVRSYYMSGSGPSFRSTTHKHYQYTHNRQKKQEGRLTFSWNGWIQGGVQALMIGSSVGGSLRMWWSHECHPGGTWEALKSSYGGVRD